MNRWTQVDPLMVNQGEMVLHTLLERGFQAFFVGGCVRDELMGRPVHDMDIATSAKPEDVVAVFERTVPTGIEHGTVTVLMDDYAFEVTTFRKESQYEDHRRPASVEFVDAVNEDLLRRDFTMNAIARDIDGALIDPYGGQSDIKRGLIRCVGAAEERFEEDALRMLRAVRFASVFGFRPAKSLWKALLRGKDKLSYIAMERVRTELEKVVLGPRPLRGLALLERSGLLRHVKAALPEAVAGDAEPERQSQARLTRQLLAAAPRRELLTALPELPPEPQALRWSLLLQALGTGGEDVIPLMKRWTFPNKAAEETAAIVRFDEAWRQAQAEEREAASLRRRWVVLQVTLGQTAAACWLGRQAAVLAAAFLSEAQRIAERKRLDLARRWHGEVRAHALSELAVSGKDVLELTGQKGGPWLGELIKQLLLSVAAGEVHNDKQALLEYVKAGLSETWKQTD
ncbi:MAG: CCA tRNA nucleotidyltransferase [Paenibacillus macerans]|uniref:CCA tRNA nucleotidyltransferase n=1 Tax=Paenibacillus macerans TaxID=44252 RepID=UPI00291573B9|nr:CCA tRNA nucleotidyltransferase [Paenibacillus macerans]MDU7474471.1 CCA tRNA nucleotidyltransferase [Paenibacillus macerans]